MQGSVYGGFLSSNRGHSFDRDRNHHSLFRIRANSTD
jgi:hypothetical protein